MLGMRGPGQLQDRPTIYSALARAPIWVYGLTYVTPIMLTRGRNLGVPSHDVCRFDSVEPGMHFVPIRTDGPEREGLLKVRSD